jgi:signal-transduction protein with cAMP-binding, CBS, and nucleotidyltransferase domain
MSCKINNLIRESLVSLDEASSVQQAAELMAQQNLGSLVVTDDGRVAGLFTERDLLRRVIGVGRDPRTLTVGEVCSRNLVSIPYDSTCEQAVHLMRNHMCRRLVVYRGDSFFGLVKLTDVAHAMADRGGRKDLVVNLFGAVTLMVAISVIAMMFYQLPSMVHLAEQVTGR